MIRGWYGWDYLDGWDGSLAGGLAGTARWDGWMGGTEGLVGKVLSAVMSGRCQ